MEKKDVGRIKSITTKTLSDFIRLEEGSTGKQNALKTGAVLGGSVLAQVLFTAVESGNAHTDHANDYDVIGHTNTGGHTSTSTKHGHLSAL